MDCGLFLSGKPRAFRAGSFTDMGFRPRFLSTPGRIGHRREMQVRSILLSSTIDRARKEKGRAISPLPSFPKVA